MTIRTKNSNPKNDSQWARHRSITKGTQNQLENVIKALKAQRGATYRHFDLRPKELRNEWSEKFDQSLPVFNANALTFKGTAGIADWLGAASPFITDLKTIWRDFAKIFVRRSDDAGKTKQVLFVCYTSTNFDLIYSKWGTTPNHKFFHWAATVDAVPKGRATIDDFLDSDDLGDESEM